jgi:hypothetical protein
LDDGLFETIARDVNVRGGAGNEMFGIWGIQANRDLQVDLGAGDDTLQLAESSILRNARIQLRNGINSAWIDDVHVVGRFTLNGGRGNDRVLVGTQSDGLFAATGNFSMGSGNDVLVLHNSEFRQLDADMGSGRDQLYVEDNTVTSRTRLQGGRDDDGLTEDLEEKNVLASLRVSGFEYGLQAWSEP